MPDRSGLLWRVLEVLAEAGALTADLSLREARVFAAERLRDRQLTDLSTDRLTTLWARFERFAWAHDVRLVSDVTPDLVGRFVRSRTTGRSAPSTATMHLRRAAIRLLFKVLREFGIDVVDPTLDIALPSRSGIAARPLTDEEVQACRWAALSTVGATRQSTVWSLGESGASTTEIARVRADDLDLDAAQLRLAGGPRTDPRRVPLTAWGTAQLARRLRSQRMSPDSLLAFDRPIDEYAGRISAGQAITAVMARAGLAHDKSVRPRSLAGWVGRSVWLETGRVEEAGRRLGMRSLDLTAELIGFDWREAQA